MKKIAVLSGRIEFSLNGLWEVEPGEKEVIPLEWNHTVPVPSLVDSADPSYPWERYEYHWYRKRFVLPRNVASRKAFLKIEQSQFGTEVWLNGEHIGGSISCYTSHEYRVDPFLRIGDVNELIVRVGQKHTLPPESAVGNDMERLSFVPGLWGDVKIIFTGSVRVRLVQILPDIARSVATVRLWIQYIESKNTWIELNPFVVEKASQRKVSVHHAFKVSGINTGEREISFPIAIRDVKLWSPESPFLYELHVSLTGENGELLDESITTFGMREFTIDGADFYLNGRKIHLRGSSIAFHRFLSDKEKGLLPWDEKWIRKVLVEIPKQHNFNFFRAHLGHMYNRWYEIADEGGIMIQDEWQFWGVTGTREQIIKEFTEWLQDNWNHPSIVLWDALNESTSEVVQKEVIPLVKALDPTRCWESYDFFEDHPYIYSLGPVLHNQRFGFSRSIDELRDSKYPSQVNEYIWWWVNKEGKPSELTKKVISRWLGEEYNSEDLLSHQAFLASELTELFRRLNVKAIQPFAYLSADNGPTSHWFRGTIENLEPKPIMAALKNAFEPFGISIELWDRHFFCGERRQVKLYVMNDYPEERSGVLRFGVVNDENVWLTEQIIPVRASPLNRHIESVTVPFPAEAGDYKVRAELIDGVSGRVAISEKVAHVYDAVRVDQFLRQLALGFLGNDDEVMNFLQSVGLNVQPYDGKSRVDFACVLVVGDFIKSERYLSLLNSLERFIRKGGTVIFIEPEYSVVGEVRYSLPGSFTLAVRYRNDTSQGGYDSYVIPQDIDHPIWKGLRKEDLQMFNGAFGGEVVSQHNLVPLARHRVLARSGLELSRLAAVEIPLGTGFIVITSLQLRGRLLPTPNCYEELYARRPDPVAQRFLVNLVEAYSRKENLSKSLDDRGTIAIVDVKASSFHDDFTWAFAAIDGMEQTEWRSKDGGTEWLQLDTGFLYLIERISIKWGSAPAEYVISASVDPQEWEVVWHSRSSDLEAVSINLRRTKARYIRIECLKPANHSFYSIREVVLYGRPDESNRAVQI